MRTVCSSACKGISHYILFQQFEITNTNLIQQNPSSQDWNSFVFWVSIAIQPQIKLHGKLQEILKQALAFIHDSKVHICSLWIQKGTIQSIDVYETTDHYHNGQYKFITDQMRYQIYASFFYSSNPRFFNLPTHIEGESDYK